MKALRGKNRKFESYSPKLDCLGVHGGLFDFILLLPSVNSCQSQGPTHL